LALLNNNFPAINLSFLENCVSLERLYLGNFTDHENDSLKQYEEKSIYNRFSGSLESLKNLKKLKVLDISNTDISIGNRYYLSYYYNRDQRDLSFLKNLEEIYCSTKERPESKVKKIEEVLERNEENFYFPNNRFIKKHKAQE